MAKLPWMPWYPADWFAEIGLRQCSLYARGGWAEILFAMWNAKVRGKLTGSVEDFAKLMMIPAWDDPENNPVTALNIIRELLDHEVCDVDFEGETETEEMVRGLKEANSGDMPYLFLTLISRRMLKDEGKRQYDANKSHKSYWKKKQKEADDSLTETLPQSDREKSEVISQKIETSSFKSGWVDRDEERRKRTQKALDSFPDREEKSGHAGRSVHKKGSH